MRFGHNFWLGGPFDTRSMRLNCILQDLFRDTPLDHIFFLNNSFRIVWSGGHCTQAIYWPLKTWSTAWSGEKSKHFRIVVNKGMSIYSESIMWADFQNGLRWRLWKLPQILYVTLYQLWYAQGYQEQASIESSVTTKVIRLKLFVQDQSSLSNSSDLDESQELPKEWIMKQEKKLWEDFAK